jgi:hypothetical protein
VVQWQGMNDVANGNQVPYICEANPLPSPPASNLPASNSQSRSASWTPSLSPTMSVSLSAAPSTSISANASASASVTISGSISVTSTKSVTPSSSLLRSAEPAGSTLCVPGWYYFDDAQGATMGGRASDGVRKYCRLFRCIACCKCCINMCSPAGVGGQPSCYKYFTVAMTWPAGRDDCIARGGHLLTTRQQYLGDAGVLNAAIQRFGSEFMVGASRGVADRCRLLQSRLGCQVVTFHRGAPVAVSSPLVTQLYLRDRRSRTRVGFLCVQQTAPPAGHGWMERQL